jgi:hypothetical protein
MENNEIKYNYHIKILGDNTRGKLLHSAKYFNDKELIVNSDYKSCTIVPFI